MSEKEEIVFLSDSQIKKLYERGILKRNYNIKGSYILRKDVIVKISVISSIIDRVKVEVKPKDDTKEWIEEWRALFPKGKNQHTHLLYRGDKQLCLKNMIKFRKTYDFSKEEILDITAKAIKEAELVNYEYFPAAHYFISKQNVGSRLAQLGELYREGGFNERRGRTVI